MQRLLSSFYYEGKPFICAAFGLYAVSLHAAGPVAKVAGVVLLGCSIAIIYMRARYRGLIR
ncbi:MAG: hypothetical protein AB7N80_03595 [Bdellovibrionales bacterium]